jgi:polysaccharide biosynthesis/export protein
MTRSSSFSSSARFRRITAAGFSARAFVLLIALALAVACGGSGGYVWASELPAAPANSAPRIRAGDRVQVAVAGQETMSGEFEVRPAGELLLPVIGRVMAVGLTATELAEQLKGRLRGLLADPHVTVVISARRLANISLLGEVRAPGRFELREGEGILEALARGGGLTPFADEDRIFVVRRGLPSRVRFRFRDLVAGHGNRFELLDGDVVVVE